MTIWYCVGCSDKKEYGDIEIEAAPCILGRSGDSVKPTKCPFFPEENIDIKDSLYREDDTGFWDRELAKGV